MALPIIPFNKPHMAGKELDYITKAHLSGKLAGAGPYTKKCQTWLENNILCKKALLAHSCTTALEMCALLLSIKSGDEVILPSYTFVSTANAFVLRGAKPVFVDIRPDTLNLDESLVEAAITSKTKVIVAVHYAGVSCEMDAILAIAKQHNIFVVEDAAQGISSTYKGIPLGSMGNLGTLSFHEAKNIMSGEGGAVLINDEHMFERSEVLAEKGTNRGQFFRGMVNQYTWQDIGLSCLPGELIAAFLWAQLEAANSINQMRLTAWDNYKKLLLPLENKELLSCQNVPSHCMHNAHMFYVILPKNVQRQKVLNYLKENNIQALFHYVPLHSSPAGKKFARISGSMNITEDLSARLIRLPLFAGISLEEQEYVVQVLAKALTIK